MNAGRFGPSSMVAVAVGALIVGLAAPSAATEASHLINGKSIKNQTITGGKLKNNTLTGKQVKESALGTVPTAKHATTATTATKLPPLVWHTITAFQNSWVDMAGHGMAGYAVDAQGVIHLRGAIEGGTAGTVAFTLPASLTDIGNFLLLPAEAADGVGYLNIGSGGTVSPYDNGASGVTSGIDLDGVEFNGSTGPDTALVTNDATHHGAFGSLRK